MNDCFQLDLLEHQGACLRFCRYGGQVLSWQPAGQPERLFLSDRSQFVAGKAIRGGIPVIFPQFSGRGSLPKHGFARDRAWSVVQIKSETGLAELELRDSPETRAIWPYAFRLGLALELQAQSLRLQLTVENCDRQAWEFTAALHSYFAVPDLATVRLQGLQGRWGTEQTTGDRFQERDRDRAFPTAIDALYAPPVAPLTLEALPFASLQIQQQGFPETVIWNPGATGAAAIADLAPGAERQFLCVEAAIAERPVRLQAGAVWQGEQVFSVAS